MKEFMESMKGKKTFFMAGLVALVTFLHSVGKIDDGVYQTILGFLGAGGLAALRMGMPK